MISKTLRMGRKVNEKWMKETKSSDHFFVGQINSLKEEKELETKQWWTINPKNLKWTKMYENEKNRWK